MSCVLWAIAALWFLFRSNLVMLPMSTNEYQRLAVITIEEIAGRIV
jgi:hypothetical protein